MTTRDVTGPSHSLPDNVLQSLGLSAADAPSLAPKQRDALLGYLRRWKHPAAARDCLVALVAASPQLVSLQDDLARAYIASGGPSLALATMRRRNALRVSASSRIQEAEAHLAAGDLASARAIGEALAAEQPESWTTAMFLADLCVAEGDWLGAEAAASRLEIARPESAAVAQLRARLWRARGDLEKALLWGRTAQSRCERDGAAPGLELLRLIEALYRLTGQPAQADAAAALLAERHEAELTQLRQTLGGFPSAERPSQPAPDSAPGGGDIAPPLTKAEAPTPDEQRRLDEALHRHFRHERFRPGQAEAIAAILRGESVLAVMPTGAGKSLCYQLASMLLPGVTLVISPLIALMKDQVDGLPDGIARHATALNSTLEGAEMDSRLQRAAQGAYRLLYVAPERLRQQPFLHALNEARVSLLVVDEAHCVSLWGHDFRPDYRFIAKAWQELGRPPILAMTATATPRVQDDVRTALGRLAPVFADVHRPNLHLEASPFLNESQKRSSLVTLCRALKGSGIVYTNSRVKCEELAEMLRKAGVGAVHYHAGIEDRSAVQDEFMCGKARVVVATVAFGMGIDKADVRFIIHYSPPRTLENYYQEAGRAGRDGLPALCTLFHSPSDRAMLTRWVQQDALTIEALRSVYAALQRRLRPGLPGLVALGDLERDLHADETSIRVAIHFLETAGLVWRGFDLPRTASLTLLRQADDLDPAFSSFVAAARLRVGQRVDRGTVDLAQAMDADLRTLEGRLLAWRSSGCIDYRGTGRDMLLALPAPQSDSSGRVAALLADFRAGQVGRVAEIMAYATTRGCRHGHISAYFGGAPIANCRACDNCLSRAGAQDSHNRQTATGPLRSLSPRTHPQTTGSGTTRDHSNRTPLADPDATLIVLRGVSQLPFPMGRTGLARALKGLPSSAVKPNRFPLFGALAAHTRKSIVEHAGYLVDEGLLATFGDPERPLLRLTESGKARLAALAPSHPATDTTDSPQIGPEPLDRLRA